MVSKTINPKNWLNRDVAPPFIPLKFFATGVTGKAKKAPGENTLTYLHNNTVKKLIQNRRSAGWNLIEIIVAVAIGASIAAAGVAAYQGEAQKAAVAKAKDFIAQVETKKQQLLADVNSGDPNAVADVTHVATQIKVQGQALTGNAGTDATTLGFKAINYGGLDTFDGNGNVVTSGSPAYVELNNGSYIYQNTVVSGAPY